MNYYNEIKNELLEYEVTKKVKEYSVNKKELEVKYNVGKMLIDAQGGESRAKYGNGLIKEYSEKLYRETGIKYSDTSLKRMRQFYLFIKKGAPMEHQLTWSHYKVLMPIVDTGKILYYINEIKINHLSKRGLEEKIKQNEYERLPQSTKDKLLKEDNRYEITDFIKDPIIIKNPNNLSVIKEKVLQKLILEDLENFMKQLGDGYSFIGSEYKIKLDNTYNYIDLLLFNIEFNSYVVIELKTTKLLKEHLGQISVYINYIDKQLKKINQNKTIGIIISRENNKYVIKYCSNPKIFNTTYKII